MHFAEFNALVCICCAHPKFFINPMNKGNCPNSIHIKHMDQMESFRFSIIKYAKLQYLQWQFITNNVTELLIAHCTLHMKHENNVLC